MTGVRRDLDVIASMFSRREALGANWAKLYKRQSIIFTATDFAIDYPIESDFRPDMTLQERHDLNAPGVTPLLAPLEEAMRTTALDQLRQEMGLPLGESDAEDIARTWGSSQLKTRQWSIELIPSVGDDNEATGFCVVGLLYDAATGRAQVFDLTDPEIEEVGARAYRTGFQMILAAINRVAFHPVHRDGIQSYFAEVRKLYRTQRWAPFWLEKEEIEIFLAWGMALSRGSLGPDGLPYIDVPRLLDDTFGPVDPTWVEHYREVFGCEDTL